MQIKDNYSDKGSDPGTGLNLQFASTLDTHTHTNHVCVPFPAKWLLQNKKLKTNSDP